jgi:hypothetical protein
MSCYTKEISCGRVEDYLARSSLNRYSRRTGQAQAQIKPQRAFNGILDFVGSLATGNHGFYGHRWIKARPVPPCGKSLEIY